MTALFSDWDLDGDLDALLIKARAGLQEAAADCRNYDSTADARRELGLGLYGEHVKHAQNDRAIEGHFRRQVSRIKEAIEKRENDRAQAEKRKSRQVNIKLKKDDKRSR